MKHKMIKFMVRMLAAAILLSSLSLTDCWGYEEERTRDNFSHELVVCSAYFDIAAEGIRRTGLAGSEEAAIAYETASMQLGALARKLSRDDVVLARYKLALEDHIKTIRGDYSNLSLLTVKYSDLCKQVLEKPEARLKYWRDKK